MIRTSDQIDAISAAWVTASAAMPAVPKRTKGQVGNATRFYADLATVIETVQPVLAANGLAFLQGLSDGDKVLTCTTRLLHISGQWIEDSLTLPTGQNTAQACGSTATYAKRYSLSALLGLATDDDDGAAASKPAAAARKAAAPLAVVPAERPPAGVDATTGEIELATDKQVQRIQIGMNGRGTRDEKLQWLADFVGRPLTTSKHLTRVEAGKVIDHLEQEATRG